MRLLRGFNHLQQQDTGCVATIGNFDGVHLGHQAIIKRVLAKAKSLQVSSCVIIFEPHPKEFFMGENCPARLSSLREKLVRLEQLGVDQVLVLKFNHQLSAMPAEQFVDDVLINKLGVKHLVVGDDFHFGFRRQGNYQLLEQMSVGQYTLEPTPSILADGHRVSSTLIRDKLAAGELNLVRQLLGSFYSVIGRVGYGDQLGRKLGFATANVGVNRHKPAVSGVFFVKAKWLQDKQYVTAYGAANCGFKPTVDGRQFKIEVHILDIAPELYGKELEVEFIQKIRQEQKFDSLDALKAQIASDVATIRKLIDENQR